ncbi:hypothetical protein NIES4102_36290 [Chondrocystis sp. NIES-4102]|nr:hypothetical protein NIES4102_36290 [Chondrocystis sp. NIES-4102]
MFKQSFSLIVFSSMITLSAMLANAEEVKVNTGNMQVSVKNGQVQVNSSPTTRNSSWLNRITQIRLFNGRTTTPSIQSDLKCDRKNSSYSTIRRSSSGTGISQSSSSSTTVSCN